MSAEYPRQVRITRSPEFRKISKEGRRVRALDMDVRYCVSPLGYARVGIVVPRFGQSAVKRNQLKRRLRELARTILLPGGGAVDIVIRCRPSAYGRTFEELKLRIDRVRREIEVASRSGSAS